MCFAIKTKVFNDIKFVMLDENDLLDLDKYVKKALTEFDLSSEELAGVCMWDRDGAPITPENFATIVNQFKTSNSFMIRLSVCSDGCSSLLTQELKFYLMENGCATIFDEELSNVQKNVKKQQGEAKERICSRSVKELAKKLVSFLEYKYTSPTKDEVQIVCESAIELLTTIGGIDVLYDSKNRRGLVWNKISYKKYRNPNLNVEMENLNLSDDNEEIGQLEPMTEDEEKEAMLFFRTCILNRDMGELKNKLRRTIKLREALIRKKGTIFHQLFPFYFVEPTLILFDFEIRSPDLNSSALIDKWEELKSLVPLELTLTERDECSKYFDKETGFFIAILKLLSTKPKFEEKVDAFIIFTNNMNDKPENNDKIHPSHPCLLAFGKDKQSISHYYVSLEKHMIPIPTEFSFLHVFDIFFKCHKVFHINYHAHIKNMMMFIDYFVFQNTNGDATVNKKMYDLAERLKL